jgi:mannose-6-phosphate isomerase-like protein (cupin superfamily)
LLPNNYRLVWQNEFVRVIHVTYGPHEKLPLHNHSDKPTVYVYLTGSGPVRFSHVEEHPFSLIRPPEEAGTFRFSPGRLEKHTVENLGDIPSQFLRVELTQLPLGYDGNSFRSPKSFDGVHTGVRTEFDTPFVQIQRIVAEPDRPAEVQPINAPGLLIAFSSTLVQPADHSGKPQTLACGDVLWIDAHRAFRVSSATRSAPGHLLRIILEPQR